LHGAARLCYNRPMSLTALPEPVLLLREALRRPLPGLQAQVRMAPEPRHGVDESANPDQEYRPAAVLVLIYPCGHGPRQASPEPGNQTTVSLEDLCLVLTLRTERVENHRGQISFLGGSMDPGEDATATALREAEEELGVDPHSMQILGSLSPLTIPHSRFCVWPVVAYAAQRPAFVPNGEEVAEVIQVEIAQLLAPSTRCEEVWQLHGGPVRVPYYAVGPHKVWGATAMMLGELLAVLLG